jgi:hypothetical protein
VRNQTKPQHNLYVCFWHLADIPAYRSKWSSVSFRRPAPARASPGGCHGRSSRRCRVCALVSVSHLHSLVVTMS